MAEIVNMPEGDPNSQQAIYEEMKREQKSIIGIQGLLAEQHYALYQNYKKCGFTKEEAFLLVVETVKEQWA